MNNFEFIKYDATPTEKHLGIATVKVYGKVILKYKIVPTKDGLSFFPAPASYKLSSSGEDIYVSAFLIDSRSEEDELNALIRTHMKSILTKNSSIVTISDEEMPF